MNATKREKYEAAKVPMAAVIEELGDPSTWDEDDAEYERSISQKSRSELPMAASSRKQPMPKKDETPKGVMKKGSFETFAKAHPARQPASSSGRKTRASSPKAAKKR